MKRKGLLLVIIATLIVTVGCFGNTQTKTPTIYADTTGYEAKLANENWIMPAEVKISKYYAGAQAEWSIRIHNGRDVLTSFSINYRVPGKIRTGYVAAPVEAENWVIITDKSLVFAPKETKDILIILAMPKGAYVESDNWEFWISVMEQGQGNVQTEMCSRWLVSMK